MELFFFGLNVLATARVNGGLILTINERINAFFSEVSNRLKFPALFFT